MTVFVPVLWLAFSGLVVNVCAQAEEIYQIHQSHLSSTRKCTTIKMSMCSDLPYNQTVYPNLLNHQSQEEAEGGIQQFNPLVKVKCSEDIKLFLCSVYAPVCTVLETPIPPCRHLCQSARNGCESLMIKFGFKWPELLECNRFPSEGMCVGENRTAASTPPSRSFGSAPGLECPSTMRASLHAHTSQLHLSSGKLEECSLPCAADNNVAMLFDSRVRRYLRLWTGICAFACCLCSVFTIFTFLVDLSRFAYPVRPILYMAVCYLGLSIVYMIGVVGEDRFACTEAVPGGNALVAQGVERLPCSALAVAHYFFSISSSVWWVVMCLAWFLAATLKWGAESIESLWVHFHFFAWGLPALLSVAVLVTNSFDGDVFTGICSVGNLRGDALLIYMFLPMVLAIGLGFLLLAMGIFSMIRIRRYIKLQQPDVDKNISKLEKLMLRISAFAVMYALPTVLSAAIFFYQAMQMPHWLQGWYTHRCLRPDRASFGFSSPREECPERSLADVQQPELMLIGTKYLSQLVVGITCAIWILSGKTIESYRKFYNRVFRGRTAVATSDDIALRGNLLVAQR